MHVISNDLMTLSRALHQAAANGCYRAAAQTRNDFISVAIKQFPDGEDLLSLAKGREADKMVTFAHDLYDAVLRTTPQGTPRFEKAHQDIGGLYPKLVEACAEEALPLSAKAKYFAFCANSCTTAYATTESYDESPYIAARREALGQTMEAVEQALGPYLALPQFASLSLVLGLAFVEPIAAAWEKSAETCLTDKALSWEQKGSLILSIIPDISQEEEAGSIVPMVMADCMGASWEDVLDGLLLTSPRSAGNYMGVTANVLSPTSYLKERLVRRMQGLDTTAPEAFHEALSATLPKNHTLYSYLELTATPPKKRLGHLRLVSE